MASRDGPAGEIGQRLLTCTQQLFHDWHRARDGELTPTVFLRNMTLLSRKVEQILEEGSACANRPTAATCCELLNGYQNLCCLFPYLSVVCSLIYQCWNRQMTLPNGHCVTA